MVATTARDFWSWASPRRYRAVVEWGRQGTALVHKPRSEAVTGGAVCDVEPAYFASGSR